MKVVVQFDRSSMTENAFGVAASIKGGIKLMIGSSPTIDNLGVVDGTHLNKFVYKLPDGKTFDENDCKVLEMTIKDRLGLAEVEVLTEVG